MTLVAVLLAGCGSDGTPAPTAIEPVTGATASATPAGDASLTHALPRWVQTATLQGSGDSISPPFGIIAEALQWRVTWHCTAGALLITTIPAPSQGKPLVTAACPGDGVGYAIQTGQMKLSVKASAPWTALVEQQIDTPLAEPPLPEMASAPVVAHGGFRDVERPAKGTLVLYAPRGRPLELRFVDFEVPINTDLFVWVTASTGLETSAQMLAAPHVVVAALQSTSGAQNYVLPATVTASQVRTVVIWCLVQLIAYAASDVVAGAAA